MSEPILEVRDLSVDFHVEGIQMHAVKNVCFELCAGETLAIVGESGSGKSSIHDSAPKAKSTQSIRTGMKGKRNIRSNH